MDNNNLGIKPTVLVENGDSDTLPQIIAENGLSSYYSISSKELEDLVTLYREDSNKSLELKSIEKLGGIDGILEKLKTSPEKGVLTDAHREYEFGSNRVFVEPPFGYCSFFKESISDIMIIMLFSAALIQIIIGCTLTENIKTGWIDGTSIILAVLVVVSVESFTNWRKEQKFHELSCIQDHTASYKVIKNGDIIDMKSDDILVGDIIYLTSGEITPADLLLIEGNKIKIDESSLTGESKLIKKDVYSKCVSDSAEEKSPIILSGTGCIEGNGKAVVIAVGDRSSKGKIKRLIDNSREEKVTPLEEKLDSLGRKLGIFAVISGISTFICLSIRLFFVFLSDYKLYKKRLNKHNMIGLEHPNKYVFSRMVDNFLIAIVIITIALPEGLPMAVALTLAFSVKKLMDKKNLVRKMNSCETMGGANYICTDKTGTLTKNCLSVVKVLTVNQEIELDDTLDDKTIESGKLKIRENHEKYFENEKFWNLLRTSISINVDGHVSFFDKADINGDTEECHCKNKTDNAFINFLYRFKSPISEILNKIPEQNRKQMSFDSDKKRMSTYVKENEDDIYRIYTKGGAEHIKEYCKYYIDSKTGEKKELDKATLENLTNKIDIYNSEMLRTLYICYKDINENEFNNINNNDDIDNLVLLAIFGIRDTIRIGVKEAVLKCKTASVNVIMVTGDNIITACSIAKECKILEDDSEVIKVNSDSLKLNPENSCINNDYVKETIIHLNENNNNNLGLTNLLLSNPPREINGDTFYQLIGGLKCSTCNKKSNECKCPKTEAEAEKMSKNSGMPKQKIKCDTIVNKENFKKIISNLKVMARSKPIHKYALVLGLKELGFVVAVTGDGTNDAPALSKSDVGFSMFDGTDIAKDSSDIILMDNNFASIVTAIKYGRNIFDNLKRFLQFQMSINLTACFITVICSCIGSQTPIKTIQMLWIDLLMDSLACFTLATERPHDAILKRKPTNKNESLINITMIKHILFQSLSLLAILMIIYLYGPYFINEQNIMRLTENRLIFRCYGGLPGGIKDTNKIIYGVPTYWSNKYELNKEMASENLCGDYSNIEDLSKAFKFYCRKFGSPAHLTIMFNVFVIYTLFNQINCRVLGKKFNIFKRILKNPIFIAVSTIELFAQINIVQFWNVVFKLTYEGLTVVQWRICFALSSFSLFIEVIIKLIPLEKCFSKNKS